MEKRKVTVYKLNSEGFFVDYESIEVEAESIEGITSLKNIPSEYAPFGWVEQNPKQRWFKPKFVDGKWVESLTQEEIQEHDNKLKNESKSKEELEELQKQLKATQQSMAEIMNLISIQAITPK